MGILLAAYIFGSVARGDADRSSDLDLLAVVQDGAGKVPEEEILRLKPTHLTDLKPSISWYGRGRLREMFANGELFAWHLYLEHIVLFEGKSRPLMVEPAPYLDSFEDVRSFRKVLEGVPEQVQASPENAIYELGLIYVCLRNVAMAASWTLNTRPDFSRWSPFQLESVPGAPLTRSDYILSMQARLAGQRGNAPPDQVHASHVIQIYDKVLPWVCRIEGRLQELRDESGG